MPVSQESYSDEVSERMTCVADIKPLDQQAKVAAEAAYRRGYFQGYFSAAEDVRRGNSLTTVFNHLYDMLFKWRYSRHGGRFELPPDIKQKRENQ